MTTRILLVDDFKQWRLAVRSILESAPGFRIVGEAGDGVEAVKKVITLIPDIVLLDVGMPLLNGIEAAKIIRQTCPKSKVIFLSQDEDEDVRSAALATGAIAYLLKSTDTCHLQSTIKKTLLQRTSGLTAELAPSGDPTPL